MSEILLTPEEAFAQFEAARMGLTTAEFFTRPPASRLQELWCAAHFARGFQEHIESCQIRFEEEQDFDFELQVRGELHPFQITEVQAPGRRRGDEYRAIDSGVACSSREVLESGTEHGHEWIRERIQKKLDRYADVSGLNLLVYANFRALELSWEVLADSCSDSSSKFESVWVVTGNGLCTLKTHPVLASIPRYSWAIIQESVSDEEDR